MAAGFLTFNNNTSNPQGMWSLYSTGGRLKGTGSYVGFEFDVFNASDTVVKLNPYTSSTLSGISLGLAIQSGGEAVEHPGGIPAFPQLSPTTAALLIAGNDSSWDRGIVFRQLSIADQFPKAIDLPANYRMRWTHDASDQTEAFISSNVGDYSKAIGLQFSPIGGLFQDPTLSGTYGAIRHVPNVYNYPAMAGGTVGQPVNFEAISPDANISIAMRPKGVGTVNLGFTYQLQASNVADLPACTADRAFQIAAVGDAASQTYNGPATGGGSGRTLVFCNGFGWLYH